MNKRSLVSMFEANRQTLEKQLAGLMLPNDANKIQNLVSDFFDKLLGENGEFRRGLSLPEDYILQAALSLLNAQQEMGRRLSETDIEVQTNVSFAPSSENLDTNHSAGSLLDGTVDGKRAVTAAAAAAAMSAAFGNLVASAGGATIGKIALSTGWGAVFGTIVGTAYVLFLAKQQSFSTPKKAIPQPKVETEIRNYEIDVTVFLDIITDVCKSVDSLITTFRTQIQNVVSKYESQEKPTLEKSYGSLLERIQILLGAAESPITDQERLAKIDDHLGRLIETLKEFGLEVISYTEENSDWFEPVESSSVETPRMIYPAIIKKGILVKTGKVFVKL